MRDPEAVRGGDRRAAVACGTRAATCAEELPELLRAEPAKRAMHAAEPVTLRVRRLIGRPRPHA